MNNYKTVKELAAELNTNKTKIFRIIKSKRIETIQKQNRFYLDETAQIRIKEEILRESEQGERFKNETEDTVEILKKELDKSHNANEELRKLLNQQQQLTLQSNKQIDQLQKQILRVSSPEDTEKITTLTTIETLIDEQKLSMLETSKQLEMLQDKIETLELTNKEAVTPMKSEEQEIPDTKAKKKSWWNFWK